MDLGISGKRGLVCASSRGLGFGAAKALAEAGVSLVMNGRNEQVLEATAASLRAEYQVEVLAVAADITTESGREAVLDACGEVDILVNNAGGPPPGDWQEWAREDFIAALDANMLTPIAMMQALVPAMAKRGWGRVVNITSQSVKAPIPVLGLSNTARTGLTGFVAGCSRQVAGQGVVINNLLPGIHDTDRMVALDDAVSQARQISLAEAREERMAGIPTGCYGDPADFGATCAFLCSQHARFIVGQNILLDGGAVNATF